jgi:hypothetical protein
MKGDPALREVNDRLGEGAHVLLAASIPLMAIRRDHSNLDSAQQLPALRRRLVELCDALIASGPSTRHLHEILQLRATMCFFWFDNAREIHDQVMALLRAYPGAEAIENRAAIRAGLMAGEFYARRYQLFRPVLDAASQLAAELSSEPSPEDRVVGLFCAYEATPHQRDNRDKLTTLLEQIYATLWEMRTQVVNVPQVLPSYLAFEALLDSDGWSGKFNPAHARVFTGTPVSGAAPGPSARQKFHFDYGLYLLGECRLLERHVSTLNAFLASDRLREYSPAQREQVIGAALQRETKFGPQRLLFSFLENDLHQAFPTEYPAENGFLAARARAREGAPVADDKLIVDLFWNPYQYVKPGGNALPPAFGVQHFFLPSPDEVWVLGAFFGGDDDGKNPAAAIFRVQLPTFETEMIWIPRIGDYYGDYHTPPRMAVSKDYVLVYGQDRPLLKYHRPTRKWSFVKSMGASDAIVTGNAVYLTSGRTVTRVDLQADAAKIVADIHREPKEGPLDSSEFEVLRLVGTVDQQICLLGYRKGGKSQRYLFDAGSAKWTEIARDVAVTVPASSRAQDQRLWQKCRFTLDEKGRAALPDFHPETMQVPRPGMLAYVGTPHGNLIAGVIQHLPGFWFVPESRIQEFLNGSH